MDIGSFIGGRLGWLNPPSAASLGRWIMHGFRGTFVHDSILSAEKISNENWIGMVAHYLIGATLGVVYFSLASFFRFSPSSLFAAIVYGCLTDVFPFLMMFPSMGFGFFASRAPQGVPLFRTAVVNHLVYGIALGATASIY